MGLRIIQKSGTGMQQQCDCMEISRLTKPWIDATAGQPTHPPTQDLTETGPIDYRQGCPLLYRATLNPRNMGEGEGQKRGEMKPTLAWLA